MLKNIIFDVGGVLLDYSWYTFLKEDGCDAEEADRIAHEITRSPYWDEMDRGTYSHADMIRLISNDYPEDAEQIRWFFENIGRIVVPRPEVWEKVRLLKEAGYRTYILSNYGGEMYELHAAHQPFQAYMEGAVVSYRIHMIKPEPEIYHYLLDQYSLKPEECLFLDDKKVNVEAAEREGIRTVRITSETFLLTVLDRLLEAPGTFPDTSSLSL